MKFKHIAGGLIDRRCFLKKGLVFSVAATVPASLSAQTVLKQERTQWMSEPGIGFSNYGHPSPFEKKTIRWTMANSHALGNGVSWTPLQDLDGIITPSGLHFERHHNGVPQIDPATHRLTIHGLVTHALEFSIESLLQYPKISRICFIECGGNSNAGWHKNPIQTPVGNFHGMVSCSEWSGIPLKLLLNETQPHHDAQWVIAEGGDASLMNISLPLNKAMDDCFIALYQNGERIRPENGYPLRLIVPGWEGVLNVKWLRRLHITNQPTMSRNETAKYTELLPSGKAQQFSFIMAAKSIITNPSFGHQLNRFGLYQISGLAWSGRGKITRVEVSADHGQTWLDAELQEPILSMCFTRFRIPLEWHGQAVVLSSRATDETGYVQPSRTELIAQRGRHGYFHYNAIVNWAISTQGHVSHVYDQI